MRFIVYGLTDPESLMIRYVGQSSQGMRRPREHTCPSRLRKTSRLYRWLAKLVRAGRKPVIVVLEVVTAVDELDSAEIWWIAMGKAFGWPLVNHLSGGGQPRGHKFTPEHRAALSNALTGRSLSESHKKAISAGTTGHATSELCRTRTAESNRTRVWTDEAREKIASKARLRRPSAESRAKMSAFQRGKPGTPKTDAIKAKISAALKGRPMMGRPRNPPKFRINLLPGRVVLSKVRGRKIAEAKSLDAIGHEIVS